MIGFRSLFVTLFLLGAALAQVEEEVTVIPEGLGGESWPVKKRSVDADVEPQSEPQDVVVQLQAMPIKFDFETIIPARLKRALYSVRKGRSVHRPFAGVEPESDSPVQLQQQAIPFDMNFIIRDKREAQVQLQQQAIPIDLNFIIRNKRALYSVRKNRSVHRPLAGVESKLESPVMLQQEPIDLDIAFRIDH